MIKKIKSIANTEEKQRLLSNFVSLFVLQGLNYLLPLLTFPYLVRVLGVGNFGLLAFSTATITYFSILTDYGFNLTATREVAIHRENKDKLIEIFSAVMMIKLILILLSFVLLLLLFVFEKFAQHWEIYLLTFGIVIGQALFPVWFFQGMERMKYITYLNIVSKAIFTIAIFLFVKEKNDIWLVPLLTSLGFIIVGVYSLFLINRLFKIRFIFQHWEVTKIYFIDGWHVFISNIAISLYTVSTTFILGLLTNNTIVGYYSAADKIIQALKGLMGPVSQAIYPYISRKVNRSKKEGLMFIRIVAKYIFLFVGLVALLTFIFSDFLVNLLMGDEFISSIIVLKLLAPTILMVGLSNIFGIQTMLNFGKKKAFSRILIAGSIINLILSFILVPFYQEIGSALSVLIVESFITITMFIYLQKNELRIIGKNKL